MVYNIDNTPSTSPFPNVEHAEQEPNGLLAVGGDLSPKRLMNAYKHGIFPWYNDDQPILWWSPDPRLVLFPERLHISRSLHKFLRRKIFWPTMDQAFSQVIQACAAPRAKSGGTWLVAEMISAYEILHALDIAHSVEVWEQDTLVGGLYGVAIGRVFFGESMFSLRNNASKVALVHLVQRLQTWGYQLIDCQVYTRYLTSMGAEEISRQYFNSLLERWTQVPGQNGTWN